jgi:hypothetical protein
MTCAVMSFPNPLSGAESIQIEAQIYCNEEKTPRSYSASLPFYDLFGLVRIGSDWGFVPL